MKNNLRKIHDLATGTEHADEYFEESVRVISSGSDHRREPVFAGLDADVDYPDDSDLDDEDVTDHVAPADEPGGAPFLIQVSVIAGSGSFFNGTELKQALLENDLLYGESSTDDPDDRTLRDALYGEGGRDVLDGGAGTDYMEGGGDGDTYPFDADLQLGYDTIHEESSPLGGNDTLDFSLTSTAVDIDLADATEQIIGGLTVKLGSRMVDSSLRTKLNAIKHAMKEAG